ncbi:MAG: hypothetical protein JWL77_2152 [Chthonomonadaceae bacterium]|nr:hypothetical protein [Chthonomonadaceae bacterium]
MSLNRFESYLDTLEHSLRSLPQAERAEWREEARQHLQEIARAAEEMGLAPDEARAEAMRLFGDAAQIGQRMAQSTEQGRHRGRAAATLFSGPLIVAMLLLIGLAYAYVSTDSPLLFHVLQCGCALAFVLVPILGGRRVGKYLRPGPSLLPAAMGLTLIGLLSMPITGVLLVPVLGAPVDHAVVDFRWGLLWLPLAGFSLWWSRRRIVCDFGTVNRQV